jgi:hypothetical protein
LKGSILNDHYLTSLLIKNKNMTIKLDKPFSQSYVLRTTAKHMRKSIDISIRKTFERIKDFDGNQEKSKEVFETLAKLHSLRSKIEDFQLQHQESFKGN